MGLYPGCKTGMRECRAYTFTSDEPLLLQRDILSNILRPLQVDGTSQRCRLHP